MFHCVSALLIALLFASPEFNDHIYCSAIVHLTINPRSRTINMSTMSCPPQWPNEVTLTYTPEQVLGRGGFGCVFMAKEKSTSNQVAVKVVKNDGYAEREVAILSELMEHSHPNIVKIFGDFEPQDGVDCYTCMRALVLSLARGPPLAYIMKKGSLGLPIAQKISSQLVNTVAFLHGHGVIHRDINPSNIIVSGTAIEDELWWNDELDEDGVLECYVERCCITLVDFGFARALRPEDFVHSTANKAETRQVLGEVSNNERGRSRTREIPVGLDDSFSKKKLRDLSALGTRNFAAPEIKRGIHNITNILNTRASMSKVDKSVMQEEENRRSSLTQCVSDYGMVVDAFSVGATIRYIVTGVPPEQDIDDYIQWKNRPVKKVIQAFKRTKSTKRYRSSDSIPGDVMDLIRDLTHYDSNKRATVRSATRHPWISEAQPECAEGDLTFMDHGGPIEYLKCAKAIP